jgi:competence protein ComEC
LLIGSYSLIFTSILWFKKRNYSRFVAFLISVIGLQSAYLWNENRIESQNELIIFNIKKNTLITERNGKKVTLFANDSLQKTGAKNNSLNAYLVGNFSHLASTKELKNTAFLNGKKILIVDSTGVYPKKYRPDILLLRQSPKINLDRLIQTIHPKVIIADASNYKTVQKHWETSCVKAKIPFHSTSEKGFYILN